MINERATTNSDLCYSNRARARFRLPGLPVAALGALCVVCGCGIIPQDVALLDVVFDRTGTLPRDGAFANMSQTVIPILLGDDTENRALCGFISINLASLPDGATVTKAVLKLKGFIPAGLVGTAFDDFGPITVDHVNVVGGITGSDYNAEAISAAIASVPAFANTETEPEEISIDVTAQVLADRAAGRPISSFRFKFDAAPTTDAANDLVAILSSVDDLAMRPFALVIFTP